MLTFRAAESLYNSQITLSTLLTNQTFVRFSLSLGKETIAVQAWLWIRHSLTSGPRRTRKTRMAHRVNSNDTVNFFTGPHTDKTAAMKFYPWPFIPSGKPFNMTVTFTPGKVIN